MQYRDTQLFIGGRWCDAADGRTLAVVNPATGAEIGRVAHAGLADLDAALACDRRISWATSCHARSNSTPASTRPRSPSP